MGTTRMNVNVKVEEEMAGEPTSPLESLIHQKDWVSTAVHIASDLQRSHPRPNEDMGRHRRLQNENLDGRYGLLRFLEDVDRLDRQCQCPSRGLLENHHL